MITQSKQPSLSIIIPTYNEARRLPQSLHIIAAFLRERGWNEQTEVIVVDDGSNDSTLPAVRVMQTHWPQLMVLALPHRGKGAAIKAGVKHATGDFVFFCDADLSMPIAEIVKFLPPQAPDAQILIGSREVAGAQRFNEPMYRHLMGRVFNGLVRLLVVTGIQDTQCGFKCLRREVAVVLCSEQRLTGMSFRRGIVGAGTVAQLQHRRDSDPLVS